MNVYIYVPYKNLISMTANLNRAEFYRIWELLEISQVIKAQGQNDSIQNPTKVSKKN